MVLPSPAKNALFDPLSGIGLNCDILTLICCICYPDFVRVRTILIIKTLGTKAGHRLIRLRSFAQSWPRNQEKKRKKKHTFVCVSNKCLYLYK